MAKETYTAKERSVSSLSSENRPMTRARKRNAVLNARVQQNSGTTRINLGGGESVSINVSFVNRSQGTIRGTLDTKNASGSNRFQFGGRSGKSFEEALDEVKRDIVRNI